jgi:hypothetical protein
MAILQKACLYFWKKRTIFTLTEVGQNAQTEFQEKDCINVGLMPEQGRIRRRKKNHDDDDKADLRMRVNVKVERIKMEMTRMKNKMKLMKMRIKWEIMKIGMIMRLKVYLLSNS